MKKVIGVIIFSVLLVLSACSNNSGAKDERTLQNFIKAYVDAGIEVDSDEKPMFQMIGAKDGVMFYVDGKKVAIYEYESEKVLNDTKKENALIKDWVFNGKFALETNDETAINIFESVK